MIVEQFKDNELYRNSQKRILHYVNSSTLAMNCLPTQEIELRFKNVTKEE